MFKAGLIGCGNIGALYDECDNKSDVYTHAGMYRRLDDIELVCAVDQNPDRLREFGSYWHIDKLYATHQEMLAIESLDVISIATPDETHADIIRDVIRLASPKIIFSEKPLSSSSAKAKEIKTLCKKKKYMSGC